MAPAGRGGESGAGRTRATNCRPVGGRALLAQWGAYMGVRPPGLAVGPSIRARTDRLVRDLDQAAEAVNALPGGLRRRVMGGLQTDIELKLREINTDLFEPLLSGQLDNAEAWASLHAFTIDTRTLLQECLLLEQGFPNRAQPHDRIDGPSDREILMAADLLVDELAARTPITAWQSFTILAVDESFSVGSRVISVRYPKPTIWDLSTVAHELGHHVARQWTRQVDGRWRNIVDDLHDRLDAWQGSRWHYLQELFADAYASYVLGPAYAAAAVVRDLDPLASLPTDSHPPSSDRVGVILGTLRALNDGYADLAGHLATLWSEMESSAGTEPSTCLPSKWCPSIVETICEGMPASGLPRGAVDDLLLVLEQEGPIEPEQIVGFSFSDLQTAAWFARSQAPNRIRVGKVGRRAERIMGLLVDVKWRN